VSCGPERDLLLDRQKGQRGLRAVGSEERVLCKAVEVALIGFLTLAVALQRSETPTKAELTRRALQNYLSPPFLGLQYGAIAFT